MCSTPSLAAAGSPAAAFSVSLASDHTSGARRSVAQHAASGNREGPARIQAAPTPPKLGPPHLQNALRARARVAANNATFDGSITRPRGALPRSENHQGTSVDPHQRASPSGTSSTGVGTTPRTARTKQMVAMIRKILLMAFRLSVAGVGSEDDDPAAPSSAHGGRGPGA